MSDTLSAEELATLQRLAEGATPGPWAWEWIADKSNEWAVGQAWRADPDSSDSMVAVEGRVEQGEVEDLIIERRLVGMNESGHASAADAAYIAAANPATLLRLLAQVREAEALKVDVEAMRVNLHATFNGGHHDEPARGAFHHGMDTLCNVLAAHQKREQTNGILPPPPAREGSE